MKKAGNDFLRNSNNTETLECHLPHYYFPLFTYFENNDIEGKKKKK